jgi:hypothetical protein
LLCGQPEQLVDDAVLGEDIPLDHSLDLAFGQHVHGFIALDRPLRPGKRPKPSPRIDAVFDQAIIMFHDIIQVLSLSELTGFRERLLLLQALESGWIGSVLVDGITRGVSICKAWSTRRKKRSAASVLRVGLSTKSSVGPVESTARSRPWRTTAFWGSWGHGARHVAPLQTIVLLFPQRHRGGYLCGHYAHGRVRGRTSLSQAKFNTKRR